ncbi:MAG TPA: DUF4266 domain-containing protein [Candidatus Didemnitutus sp.]|nr:DUF4266 domain-containing protein [Candidatus Didemnitutus sp.]
MKTHSLRLLAAFAFIVLSLGSLGGCASAELTRVQPWERSMLADDLMRPDRDPLATALTEHVYFSRESAAGGRGVGGSGCGCN